jgi:hypothetical protein
MVGGGGGQGRVEGVRGANTRERHGVLPVEAEMGKKEGVGARHGALEKRGKRGGGGGWLSHATRRRREGGGPVPQGRSRSGGVRAGDRQSEREVLPGGPQPQCRVARRG